MDDGGVREGKNRVRRRSAIADSADIPYGSSTEQEFHRLVGQTRNAAISLLIDLIMVPMLLNTR